MQVEIFVSPECPTRKTLEGMIRKILSEMAPESTFRTIFIISQEEAVAMQFPGSPTVRINGRDVEGGGEKSSDYGLG